AGHREVAVRYAEIGAQVRAIERGLQRHQRIEVLGHLPEQEVAVTANAHQPVRPQQQTPAEALDRLAELDLGARLTLGRQATPRAVELVEGEADDLAPFGGLGGHARQSNKGVASREQGAVIVPSATAPRSLLPAPVSLLPDLLQHQHSDRAK